MPTQRSLTPGWADAGVAGEFDGVHSTQMQGLLIEAVEVLVSAVLLDHEHCRPQPQQRVELPGPEFSERRTGPAERRQVSFPLRESGGE